MKKGSVALLLALLSGSAQADNSAIQRWLELLRATPEALAEPIFEQEKYIPIKDWRYSPPPPFSRTYLTPLLQSAFEAGVITRRKTSERLTPSQADLDWCKDIVTRNHQENSVLCVSRFDVTYDDWEWCDTECHANWFPNSMRPYFDVDDETWRWLQTFPRLEGAHTFGQVADLIEARFSGRIQVVVSIGEITARESE